MGKNMKKRFLGLLISCCFASVLVAAPVYRMGSYNIRGKNDSDTGDNKIARNCLVTKYVTQETVSDGEDTYNIALALESFDVKPY